MARLDVCVNVSRAAKVDLGPLGLDRGGHILLLRALRGVSPGERVRVCGRAPELAVHLRAFCRQHGHALELATDGGGALNGAGGSPQVATVVRGEASDLATERAGQAALSGVVNAPPGRWGLAARGAAVERGGPEFHFPLATKDTVWADEAARLYAQAVAAQWDPATAIPWDAPLAHPPEVEDAIVAVMTYLIENETAALIIPARFASQIHPHFREVMQLLAIQAADEARHVEVFTRRALLCRETLGRSSAGGQASLKTLLEEPDFAQASFLLSVLGEGSFLSLLWFLHEHAPDPITQKIMLLAGQDEARHVAFGLAHLSRHCAEDPTLRGRLAAAIERRHDALQDSAGLNAAVFDALILLAAGSWHPDAIARGHDAVLALVRDMDQGRQRRLVRLGFSPEKAATLSSLHTKNFM